MAKKQPLPSRNPDIKASGRWEWEERSGSWLKVALDGFVIRPQASDYKTNDEFKKACIAWRREVRLVREELENRRGESGPMRERGTLGRPTQSPADGFQAEHGFGAIPKSKPATILYTSRDRDRMEAGMSSFGSTNAGVVRYDAYVVVDPAGMWAADREAWLNGLNRRDLGATRFMNRLLR